MYLYISAIQKANLHTQRKRDSNKSQTQCTDKKKKASTKTGNLGLQGSSLTRQAQKTHKKPLTHPCH